MSDIIATNVPVGDDFGAANNNTRQILLSNIVGHMDGYGMQQGAIVTSDYDRHCPITTEIVFDI